MNFSQNSDDFCVIFHTFGMILPSFFTESKNFCTSPKKLTLKIK